MSKDFALCRDETSSEHVDCIGTFKNLLPYCRKDLSDHALDDSPVNQALIGNLARATFLDKQRDVVLIVGTGRAHLAIAIARAGRPARLADMLSSLDLVVLDELGHLPFARSGGQLLLHLASRLHGATLVIVTTDRAVDEWPSVLGEAKMTTGLLDRLTHHCDIVEASKESRRFKNRSRTTSAETPLMRLTAPPPPPPAPGHQAASIHIQ